MTGVQSETPPVPGDKLVLSIHAGVQAVAEQALEHAVEKARTRPDRAGDGTYKADSGAIVDLEAETRTAARARQLPVLRPVGVRRRGVRRGVRPARRGPRRPARQPGDPGGVRAGVEFKAVSTAAVPRTATRATASTPAPAPTARSAASATSRARRSGRSRCARRSSSPATPSSTTSPTRSGCATAATRRWRSPATRWSGWRRPSGSGRAPASTCRASAAARSPTGSTCRRGGSGCATTTARARSTPPAARRRANKEFCDDGNRFRGGDAANFAIGQGDTLVTPLQLATVYAAIANGGTVLEPHVARALLSADGTRVREVRPKSAAAPSGRRRTAGSWSTRSPR